MSVNFEMFVVYTCHCELKLNFLLLLLNSSSMSCNSLFLWLLLFCCVFSSLPLISADSCNYPCYGSCGSNYYCNCYQDYNGNYYAECEWKAGAIAGIVIGCVVFVCLCLCLLSLCYRRRYYGRWYGGQYGGQYGSQGLGGTTYTTSQPAVMAQPYQGATAPIYAQQATYAQPTYAQPVTTY